jgi:hypothetical protein
MADTVGGPARELVVGLAGAAGHSPPSPASPLPALARRSLHRSRRPTELRTIQPGTTGITHRTGDQGKLCPLDADRPSGPAFVVGGVRRAWLVAPPLGPLPFGAIGSVSAEVPWLLFRVPTAGA